MPAITQWKDGDEPDKLVDETTELLKSWKERLEPILEEAKEEGISCALIMSYCDPLTDMSHSEYAMRGSYYQNIGAVAAWLQHQING